MASELQLNGGGGGGRAKVEYSMLTELEHILKRPDMYVGSLDNQTIPRALVYNLAHQNFEMRENLIVCPALGKLCDELLVNVADHKTRNPQLVKRCKVTLDETTGELSVWNDGPGIDVEIHPDWGIYKVQGIFGNLRSSSNYNDNEESYTGGRNGHGAKLANVFSTRFTVTTCDGVKKYTQTWTDNMTTVQKPKIRTMSSKHPKTFTQISFVPDWTKFGDGVDAWTPDMLAWIVTRCVELAGVKPKLEVTFNGVKISVKGFRAWSKAIAATMAPEMTTSFRAVNAHWEVALAPSVEHQSTTLSFVNAIATTKNGTHARHVRNQIVREIKAQLKKKYKHLRISNAVVESNMLLMINAMISNPAFESQTKEELTLPASKFRVKCAFTKKQLTTLISGCRIVDVIAERCKGPKHEEKKFQDAKKARRLTIPKLDDAVWAGGSKSLQCTLIVTEGDSAKAAAVAGFAIVGRQKYGVFPLRGKPINVRSVSRETIKTNCEYLDIVKILGIRQNVDYRDPKVRQSLRYGRLMIMADQDDDGTHIKALIANLIAVFNPTLLAIDFLYQFITPVIRARKGKVIKSFYSIPEFAKWSKTVRIEQWKPKYYKGLGTSTSSEAREYFRDLPRHMIPFDQVDVDDHVTSLVSTYGPVKVIKGKRRASGSGGGVKVEATSPNLRKELQKHLFDPVYTIDTTEWTALQWLELGFEKDLADVRKKWMAQTPVPQEEVASKQVAKYDEFFNNSFLLYCLASIDRAIPHVLDGFKPSQRKIFWVVSSKRKNSEIKVAALAGVVSETANYHHGEASMMGTIVKMAQNFSGSNNVNLMEPIGQFGTRLCGGSDNASPRYIFTKLDPVARTLFPKQDDGVLAYKFEEGHHIEPFYYVPVIPMSLVNGTSGIATGWSSQIPAFDPLAIIDTIAQYLKTGDWDLSNVTPFTRGFEGEYEHRFFTQGTKWIETTMTGVIRMTSATMLEVTELPPNIWTQPYIECAITKEICVDGVNKTADDVRNLGTESVVRIQIKLGKELAQHYAKHKSEMSRAEFQHLLCKDWGMRTKVAVGKKTTVLLDTDGKPRLFTIGEIFQTHARARLELYETRKRFVLDSLQKDKEEWDMKVLFVHKLLNDELVVRKRPMVEIRAQMTELGFPEDAHGILLKLPLDVQTQESIDAWTQKVSELDKQIAQISATSAQQFWLHELTEAKKAIQTQNEQREKSLTD